MSNDLVALVVALTLGSAVIVLGLRRNLSKTTRNGLPSFERDPVRATATPWLYEGEEGRRRPLSLRQTQWMIAIYLLMGISFAVDATLSAHSRLSHTILAATFALGAVVFWLRKPSPSSNEPSGTPCGALDRKPTPGFEPGTPSLRVKCSTN